MIRLLTLIISLLSLSSLLAKECSPSATFGSTKIDVRWSPCGVAGTGVSLYHISLEDNSKHTFNQSATVECRDTLCEYTFDLVKPCLNYTISLVMTLKNGTSVTYDTFTDRTQEEIPTAVATDGVTEGFNMDNATSDSISVSWSPPEIGNTKYFSLHYFVGKVNIASPATTYLGGPPTAVTSTSRRQT